MLKNPKKLAEIKKQKQKKVTKINQKKLKGGGEGGALGMKNQKLCD